MKTKLCVLAVVAFFVWGMKRHYSDARVDDLAWILSPTARVVSLTTGTAFAPAPGEGYISHERLFLIEKTCAGINFMIAAFGVLVFALFHRVRSVVSGAGVLAVSLAVSYVTAVVVNATRIVVAMWLAAHPLATATFTAADVHRLEGIAIYFGGLVLLYELASRVDGSPVLSRFRP